MSNILDDSFDPDMEDVFGSSMKFAPKVRMPTEAEKADPLRVAKLNLRSYLAAEQEYVSAGHIERRMIEEEGTVLNYRKHGFSSLDELMSACTDSVDITMGANGKFLYRAKTNEANRDIRELVARQSRTGSRDNKRGSRSLLRIHNSAYRTKSSFLSSFRSGTYAGQKLPGKLIPVIPGAAMNTARPKQKLTSMAKTEGRVGDIVKFVQQYGFRCADDVNSKSMRLSQLEMEFMAVYDLPIWGKKMPESELFAALATSEFSSMFQLATSEDAKGTTMYHIKVPFDGEGCEESTEQVQEVPDASATHSRSKSCIPSLTSNAASPTRTSDQDPDKTLEADVVHSSQVLAHQIDPDSIGSSVTSKASSIKSSVQMSDMSTDSRIEHHDEEKDANFDASPFSPPSKSNMYNLAPGFTLACKEGQRSPVANEALASIRGSPSMLSGKLSDNSRISSRSSQTLEEVDSASTYSNRMLPLTQSTPRTTRDVSPEPEKTYNDLHNSDRMNIGPNNTVLPLLSLMERFGVKPSKPTGIEIPLSLQKRRDRESSETIEETTDTEIRVFKKPLLPARQPETASSEDRLSSASSKSSPARESSSGGSVVSTKNIEKLIDVFQSQRSKKVEYNIEDIVRQLRRSGGSIRLRDFTAQEQTIINHSRNVFGFLSIDLGGPRVFVHDDADVKASFEFGHLRDAVESDTRWMCETKCWSDTSRDVLAPLVALKFVAPRSFLMMFHDENGRSNQKLSDMNAKISREATSLVPLHVKDLVPGMECITFKKNGDNVTYYRTIVMGQSLTHPEKLSAFLVDTNYRYCTHVDAASLYYMPSAFSMRTLPSYIFLARLRMIEAVDPKYQMMIDRIITLHKGEKLSGVVMGRGNSDEVTSMDFLWLTPSGKVDWASEYLLACEAAAPLFSDQDKHIPVENALSTCGEVNLKCRAVTPSGELYLLDPSEKGVNQSGRAVLDLTLTTPNSSKSDAVRFEYEDPTLVPDGNVTKVNAVQEAERERARMLSVMVDKFITEKNMRQIVHVYELTSGLAETEGGVWSELKEWIRGETAERIKVAL